MGKKIHDAPSSFVNVLGVPRMAVAWVKPEFFVPRMKDDVKENESLLLNELKRPLSLKASTTTSSLTSCCHPRPSVSSVSLSAIVVASVTPQCRDDSRHSISAKFKDEEIWVIMAPKLKYIPGLTLKEKTLKGFETHVITNSKSGGNIYVNGDLPPPPPPPPPTHNFTLLLIRSKDKLTGLSYMYRMRSLKMTLRYVNNEYVLDTPVPKIDKEIATPEELVEYNQHVDDTTKTYEMNLALAQMSRKKAGQEHYEVVKALITCKLKEEEYVCAHVHKMERHMERLEKLNVNFNNELSINMVLDS
uniref:Uncharacterized protein n=1 Tax=Lactuca sativa TaxID=4236 RepID=A0A9R1UGC6_LACSA|nr:hypothetical protein LSAT_V11C900465860 [Lactuca sativa]